MSEITKTGPDIWLVKENGTTFIVKKYVMNNNECECCGLPSEYNISSKGKLFQSCQKCMGVEFNTFLEKEVKP